MLRRHHLLPIHLDLLLCIRHSILFILRRVLWEVIDVLPDELRLWLSKVQYVLILVLTHWRTFFNKLPRLARLIVQGSETV